MQNDLLIKYVKELFNTNPSTDEAMKINRENPIIFIKNKLYLR